ncbi:MAG: acyltransferase [Candidatus Zixiibacteriota bacterium]|nr:MAG: acyltransferase [candidate division Zixibacteria bacterium]
MLLKSKLYYENLLRYRCEHVGRNLMLYGEVPFITGTGKIYIGDDVEIFDKVTFFTGGHVYEDSEIKIGNGCSLGFMVQLRVAQRIEIGNNCMIAGWVRISDYDGHPLVPGRKEKGLKVGQEDVKPVIIEDDVWIGEGAIILKGVTIGKGSIISSGSVVTRSVPPMKIVMGNPGRVAMWVADAKESQSGADG